MDTPTLNLPLPGMIDGDIEQVQELTVEALYDSMDQFAEWIDAAVRQLANAERQRILEAEPSMTADALASEYEDTPRHATLTRLNGAAKAMVSAVMELRR